MPIVSNVRGIVKRGGRQFGYYEGYGLAWGGIVSSSKETDISILRMFRDLGISAPASQKAAQDALADAGIISSRPNRVNIAASKVERSLQVLQAVFFWRCGGNNCAAKAEAVGRQTLLVERAHCMICGGSNDRRALEEMASAAAASNVSKILVVGGTDAKRREIREKSPRGVEWRFVDGKKSKDDRYFRHNRRWAEVIAIWGSTELDHKVSEHFVRKGDARIVTVSRRGIGALADGVVRHLTRG